MDVFVKLIVRNSIRVNIRGHPCTLTQPIPTPYLSLWGEFGMLTRYLRPLVYHTSVDLFFLSTYF